MPGSICVIVDSGSSGTSGAITFPLLAIVEDDPTRFSVPCALVAVPVAASKASSNLRSRNYIARVLGSRTAQRRHPSLQAGLDSVRGKVVLAPSSAARSKRKIHRPGFTRVVRALSDRRGRLAARSEGNIAISGTVSMNRGEKSKLR